MRFRISLKRSSMSDTTNDNSPQQKEYMMQNIWQPAPDVCYVLFNMTALGARWSKFISK